MVTKGTNIITFEYTETELWDKVQQHVGLVVKNLPEPDKLYPNSDDITFFKREMFKAIVSAFEPVSKLSLGNLTDVYTTTTNNVTVYGFKVKDPGVSLNATLTVIDDYIETYLVFYFLKSWWLKVQLADQYKVATEDLRSIGVTLNNSYHFLFRPTVAPTPSYTSENVTLTITDESSTEEVTSNNMPEILYFETLAAFPTVGQADIVYVDRSSDIMYYYDGTYKPYKGISNDQINFIFSDIDVEAGQVYTIDLQASFAYTINKAVLQSDSGTIVCQVSIDGMPVEGLDEMNATSTVGVYTAQYNNEVSVGSTVTLTILTIIDSPITLTGNILISR